MTLPPTHPTRALLFVLAFASIAEAQERPAGRALVPKVVGQDEEGRISVRATSLTEPIDLDGRLDEPVYKTVQPITDFIQQIPDEGAPASERTEAWVFFDNDNIYVTARNYESVPPSSTTRPSVEKLSRSAPDPTPFSCRMYAAIAAYSSSLREPGSLTGMERRV